MKNFRQLAKVIKSLNSVSKQIIATSRELMEQIQSEDSEFVDDLIDAKGLDVGNDGDDVSDGSITVDRKQLLEDLQNVSLSWIEDAETVKRELEHFIVSSGSTEEQTGIFQINENTEDCPFLTEVWCGDMYGDAGIDGLRALLKHLNDQLSNITGEKLVAKAAAM